MKFLIIKLKHAIIPFSICLFTMFLVIYSSNNLVAARNGLVLWATAIVPSMFPFFIATELLSYTRIIPLLGKILNKIMKPLFNVPGEGAFALIMGILSGYPVGAKIVSSFKERNICSNVECERLLAYTNNSGPLFIIGTVGVGMFFSQAIGFKLFIIHILSCLIVGFLFRWWKKDLDKKNNTSTTLSKIHSKQNNISSVKNLSLNNLGEVLSCSIQSSIKSILIIGGFVVLFSVIVSMLSCSNVLNILENTIKPILLTFHIPFSFSKGIIVGLIEITNGLKLSAILSNNISIIICSFLLGFGGISIFLQVLSITSKAKISIKPYIIGKLLQASISAILMWFFLK